MSRSSSGKCVICFKSVPRRIDAYMCSMCDRPTHTGCNRPSRTPFEIGHLQAPSSLFLFHCVECKPKYPNLRKLYEHYSWERGNRKEMQNIGKAARKNTGPTAAIRKYQSATQQVRALDSIKNELLQATKPSLDKLESKLSELSIQHMETKKETRAIIEKSKQLEEMHAAILSEMTIEFDTIRQICEKQAAQSSKNQYMLPTATANIKKSENTPATSPKAEHIIDNGHGKTFSKDKPHIALVVPQLDIPSTESTPRKQKDSPAYKPLLDHDYVMYQSPLLKGIDWNAETPSPIESPKATTSNTSNQRRTNLSLQAAALCTEPIIYHCQDRFLKANTTYRKH